MEQLSKKNGVTRRRAIESVLGVIGAAVTLPLSSYAASPQQLPGKKDVKITKLETVLIKPRWLFLKVHTNAGIVGLGEPIVEGRALTVQTAIKEIEPYLIGKDPRQVVHHWQAIYRHAFYRGGPVLTSAISGIDMALWDIKGKALGVPVYDLLGGAVRDRIRVYASGTGGRTLEELRDNVVARVEEGYTALKMAIDVAHGGVLGRTYWKDVVARMKVAREAA